MFVFTLPNKCNKSYTFNCTMYFWTQKSIFLAHALSYIYGLQLSCIGSRWHIPQVHQSSNANVMDCIVKVIASHHKIKCSGDSGNTISCIFPEGNIHHLPIFMAIEPLNYGKAITVKDKNKFLQASGTGP